MDQSLPSIVQRSGWLERAGCAGSCMPTQQAIAARLAAEHASAAHPGRHQHSCMMHSCIELPPVAYTATTRHQKLHGSATY